LHLIVNYNQLCHFLSQSSYKCNQNDIPSKTNSKSNEGAQLNTTPNKAEQQEKNSTKNINSKQSEQNTNGEAEQNNEDE